MNVMQLAVPKEEAAKALLDYKQHRGVYDKIDWEIERVYRAVSRGRKVISVNSAIQQAGLDELGRPKLAVGRADAQRVRCTVRTDELEFNSDLGCARWKMTVALPGQRNYANIAALVPRIPPQHRPAKHLENYHILWEADWTEIPRDPYLLRRIGKDAWIVLAAWDLTEVELSVLRAHRTT